MKQSTSTTLIGLYNPKSPSNVGAVMRAAGCYQVDGVRYTGERYERGAQYQLDTRNAQSQIPLTRFNDLLTDIPDDISVVCVELVENATPLPEFQHPQKALYLFGPEDASLPQELVSKAQSVVYIPTVGCMNLAATVNVLLYDRLAKSNDTIDHKERIKNSRDVNNRLRINHSTTQTK